MKFVVLILLSFICCASLRAAAPASAPANPDFEKKLADIDTRAGKIQDFTARFEQQKFTALLRKPLLSSGTIRVVGALVRWDTEKPEPSVLYSDGKELKMYYPKQKLLEVYPIDRRMADLVASPIPRLAILKEKFSFEPLPLEEATKDAPDLVEKPEMVAVRLRPTDAFLKEHVREVRVLLDGRSARMLCVTTVDADGDRTVMRFRDVRENAGVKPADVQLVVPADVKVSRPLEGVGN